MPHQVRREAFATLHHGLLRVGKDGGNLRNGASQGGRTMRAWPRVLRGTLPLLSPYGNGCFVPRHPSPTPCP